MKKKILVILFLFYYTQSAFTQINRSDPDFQEVFSFRRSVPEYPEKTIDLIALRATQTNKIDLFHNKIKLFEYYWLRCVDLTICEYYCFDIEKNFCLRLTPYSRENLNIINIKKIGCDYITGIETPGFIFYINGKGWLYAETCCFYANDLMEVKSIMRLDEKLIPIEKLNFCKGSLISKSRIKYGNDLITEEVYSLSSVEYHHINLATLKVKEIYDLLKIDYKNTYVGSYNIKPRSYNWPIWAQGSAQIDHCMEPPRSSEGD